MTDMNMAYTDSDGSATQWASGISSQKAVLQDQLEENNGTAVFPALFDLEGNLVAAKLIDTRFGESWALLDNDDARNSSFIGFFSSSKARSDIRRVLSDERKGYYVGEVRVPAGVGTRDNGGYGYSGATSVYAVIYRRDGGFSRDAEIVDNGK